MKHAVLFLIIVLLMSGCQKIGEYYLGLNMQPELPREDFQPGLNIYGVLKTGDDFDTLNHYFEVEQLIYVMDSFDSVYVTNAIINLTRLTIDGKQTSYQLKHYHDGVYLNTDIEILPGERWTYQCNYDTFEVTAECYIPNTPQLKGAANIATDQSVQFEVLADTTACMYDIYLLNGENYFFEKRVPQKGIDTQFDLKPQWNVKEGANLLFIFAYDKNLVKYFTTSNTFFKPNAFRPSFTTVDGGFGTFGGISSLRQIVK